MTPTGLLDLHRAAEHLGIAPVTLRLWTYQGKVGFVRLGRRKLFTPEELARVVRENTVRAQQGIAGAGQAEGVDDA